MKLSLNMSSVAALRDLAAKIPAAMENIVGDTEQLLSTYHSLSGSLGVHEQDFQDMLLFVKRAQETSAEAIGAVPGLLTATADKIENYVHRQVSLPPGGEGKAGSSSGTAASQQTQLRQRTIFELTALRDSLDLTDGDPDVVQMGGAYSRVRESVDSTRYEAHHIPPKSIFANSMQQLPAIAMLKEDHEKTSSYRGRMKAAHQPCFPGEAAYPRHKQGLEELVGKGLFAEAVRNEIYELRESFGSKYDGAIKQYLNFTLDYVGRNGVPKLKE